LNIFKKFLGVIHAHGEQTHNLKDMLMIHPEIVPHCYHYYFNTDLHPRLITSSWWQSLRIMIPNISDNQINA
jgi:hypothetical protein